MTVTYFDKAVYLLGHIGNFRYYETKCEQAPFDDPYERLIWENQDVPKPSKLELDILEDNHVRAEIDKRIEVQRKQLRNQDALTNLSLIGSWNIKNTPENPISFNDYLDSLEDLAREVQKNDDVPR